MAHLRAVLPPQAQACHHPPPFPSRLPSHGMGITALTRHKDREHPPRAHNEGVSAPVHQFKIILRTGAACYLRRFLRVLCFTPSHTYTYTLIASPTSYIHFIYLFSPFQDFFIPLLTPSLKSPLNLRSSLALHMINHAQLYVGCATTAW